YGLAWVRPSTHPYARDHLPVSHRTGLSLPSPKVATDGDIAFRRPCCKRWGCLCPNRDWLQAIQPWPYHAGLAERLACRLRRPPLFRHALVPRVFRPWVSRMTQARIPESLLPQEGIR